MNIRRSARRWCGAVAIATGSPLAAAAQMPATPVLQNAWTNAGITAALDYGHAQSANAWAAALAWSPQQARFQLSLGGGVIKDSTASRGGYGGRLAVPLVSFAGGSIGTAAFGGVGYSGQGGVSMSNFPVGVSLGWRHALGATRGISAYVAPFYSLMRLKVTADSATGRAATNASKGFFRASVGLDVTLAPQIGLTVGYEAGSQAKDPDPGPRGGVFGVAVSYALRRQQ